MKLTKREYFAAHALQGLCALSDAKMLSLLEAGANRHGERTVNETFAREAVEFADALCAALDIQPSGKRRTDARRPCAVKRAKPVHASKGVKRGKLGEVTILARRASDWIEANHEKGATMESAAEKFGVNLGTLKTYRQRWIDEGSASPLPGGSKRDPIAVKANAFFEAGGVTVAQAAEKFGITKRKLENFRRSQLSKETGGAEG